MRRILLAGALLSATLIVWAIGVGWIGRPSESPVREAARDGESRVPPVPRLLVVGLDGADWQIVDRLVQAGRMPHLAGLIAQGTRAKLRSISPMLSPVVWTSIATGVEPDRHGVFDFLVPGPDGSTPEPVTSSQRRVPTFWEILSRRGIEVGVVGWWASWPADPVRGYLVSDRIAYQLFGFRADVRDPLGKTWPPDLYAEIANQVVEPQHVGWERLTPFLDGPRRLEEEFDAQERELLGEFRTLLASGDSYLAIADGLRRRRRPALEVVYFEGTDTVGHLFMPYRRPWQAGIDPDRAASFSEMVDRYYEVADDQLGRLLADRDPTDVMVLSDHGFASDGTRPRTTDSRIGHGAAADWHRRFGILVLAGPSFQRGKRLDEASIYDIAPTVLALFDEPIPRSWPGRVLEPALTEAFVGAHPIRFREDDPVRERRPEHSLRDPAAADLMAKLRSLGYVAPAADGEDIADGATLTSRNNAGLALLGAGRAAEAERAFREALAIDPSAPMARVNLGLALMQQGRHLEARTELEATAGIPLTRAVAGQALATIDLESGKLDAARRRLRELLAAEPEDARLLNLLGLVEDAAGRTAEAEQAFLKAAGLDPDAALARNNLGNLFSRRGDPAQAEAWYLRAIEADPWFMGAYNNLALIYQNQGLRQRAVDLYGRALSRVPDDAVVLNNLASLHFAYGERTQARELWERAVTADPDYPSPLNNLASIAILEQRYDEAEDLLVRALTLEPAYGDAHLNRALIRRARGDLDQARAELELALLDPRSTGSARAQLGFIDLELGRNIEAAAELRQALASNPNNLEGWNALAEAYRRLGRGSEALDAWKRSLVLEPRQPRIAGIVAEAERQAAAAGPVR